MSAIPSSNSLKNPDYLSNALPCRVGYSQFVHVQDNRPHPVVTGWEGFCNSVSEPRITTRKEDNPLISGAEYPAGKTRANANVDQIGLILLDFDGSSPAEALAKLPSFEAMTWTTYSHGTLEKPKASRVAIPVSEPIPADIYPSVWRYLQAESCGAIDPATKDPARIMYVPSCPQERAHLFEALHQGGEALNWRALDLEPYVEQDTQPIVVPRAELADHKSLASALDAAATLDYDYRVWLAIGFALFDALGNAGYSLFDRFSRAYLPSNDKDRLPRIAKLWRDLKTRNYTGKRASLHSLFFYARRGGWIGTNPFLNEWLPNSWEGCKELIREHDEKALPVVARYLSERAKATPHDANKRLLEAACLTETGRDLRKWQTPKQRAKIADDFLYELGLSELQARFDVIRETLLPPLMQQGAAAFEEHAARINDYQLNGDQVYCERYVQPLALQDGQAVILKSDLSTGKTYAVERDIAVLDAECDWLKPRVCVVSPRQALSEALGARLDLDIYNDEATSRKTGRLSVCYNSILNFKAHERQFDLLVLDESEILAQHAIGGAVSHGMQNELLSGLIDMIRKAKRVVLCDAYAGDLSQWLLEQAGRSFSVIENTFKRWDNQKTVIHSDANELLQSILVAMDAQEPVFVCGTPKQLQKINVQAQQRGCKALLLTAETINETAQQAFLSDPTGQAELYDAILASPTIGTGVSVEAAKFKKTYGLFYGGDGTGTATDALQHLGRNRCAEEWHIYIDHRPQHLATELSQVTLEQAARFSVAGQLSGTSLLVDLNGNTAAQLSSHAITWRNIQKQSLKRTMQALLEQAGCAITYVDEKGESEFAKELKAARLSHRAEQLTSAAKIDDEQAAALANARQLSEQQALDLERHRIESELCADLDSQSSKQQVETISAAEDKTLREVCKLETAIAEPDDIQVITQSVITEAKDNYADDRLKLPIQQKVLSLALQAAGIESPDRATLELTNDHSWTSASLRKTEWFIWCKANKDAVNASGCGFRLGADFERSPARALGEMLKGGGIKTSSVQVTLHTGTVIYNSTCVQKTRARQYSVAELPAWYDSGLLAQRLQRGSNHICRKLHKAEIAQQDDLAMLC